MLHTHRVPSPEKVLLVSYILRAQKCTGSNFLKVALFTLPKLRCKSVLITQSNVCSHTVRKRDFIIDLANKFQERNVLEAEDPICTPHIP